MQRCREWPILAQRLSARTLALPPHARLREELLNLCVEMGPTGVRVTDRGKVHQDHAVAVRGVVAQLATRIGGGQIYARGLSAEPTRIGLCLVGDGPALRHVDYETEHLLARESRPRRLLD
jgi:hypothetical protein